MDKTNKLKAITLTMLISSTKYAHHITRGKNFLKWLAYDDGRVFNCAHPSGELWVSEIASNGTIIQGYSFLALNSALGLLAGA